MWEMLCHGISHKQTFVDTSTSYSYYHNSPPSCTSTTRAHPTPLQEGLAPNDESTTGARDASASRAQVFYFFTKRSFSARLRVRTHDDDEQIATMSQPNNTHDGTRMDGSTTTTMAWGSKRVHVSSSRYVFSLFFFFTLLTFIHR
jgi:hypothetical protein